MPNAELERSGQRASDPRPGSLATDASVTVSKKWASRWARRASAIAGVAGPAEAADSPSAPLARCARRRPGPLGRHRRLRRGRSRPRGCRRRRRARHAAGSRSARRSGSAIAGRSTARPIEVLADDIGIEVEHALPEPGRRRRAAVVDDVRRQDRHHRRVGGTVAAVEVVADGARIHDEQRPRVVRVRWIRVRPERRVEDLAHTGHRGLPGPHGDRIRRECHRRIVQDRIGRPALAWDRVEPAPTRRLRVRELRDARTEQHPPVGIRHGLRIPALDPARRRHGDRDRRDGTGGRRRPRRADRDGPAAPGRHEARRFGVPALPRVPDRRGARPRTR